MYEQRLVGLREELARRRLDGFVVPLADEHMSEYVGAYARRLEWLTGFSGSAGTAVVLPEQAALFVDGRYTLQARQQVDEHSWNIHRVLQTSVVAWLQEHAPRGARLGFDPWLHTRAWARSTAAVMAKRGGELVAVAANPIDAVWSDQPAPSMAPASVYPDHLAGRTSLEKRSDIAQWLQAQGADAVVLTALDSIAWTFNIRGEDINHTPLVLAFAVVQRDGSADLFISRQKLGEPVITHLGASVRLHAREQITAYLTSLAAKKIVIDPDRSVAAISQALDIAGATIIEARDPTLLPKACKNDVEIAGHKAAQLRDGVALTRFLHWLASQVHQTTITELSAAARLRAFRDQTQCLRDLSFESISAFGPNAAVVHYRPSPATDRPLVPDGLYLIDSGGQYLDGTTDVTRTILIGSASAEMRDRYTQVLKGHIALASAVFPSGTCGFQLDILARQFLWSVGCDYAHGTGHGVGAYLCVHEGPQAINGTVRASEPLVPGMILSDEPGYYKEGEFGIRLESLLLVAKRDIPGAHRDMLGFEVLTLAPFDRALINVDLLTASERAWVDEYHRRVMSVVGPQLDDDARAWLVQVTRPLAAAGA